MTARKLDANGQLAALLLGLIAFSQLCGSASGQHQTVQIPSDVLAKVAAIEKRIAELKAADRQLEARELAEKHSELMDCIRERTPLPKSAEEVELHVVGVYEGRADTDQTAAVTVTYAEKPVILALCAYEPVWWTIEVRPGVKIEKILLGGSHHQEIEKMPAGIKVESHVAEDGDRDSFQAYSLTDDSYPATIRTLKQLTGRTPATFTGAYRAGQEPLVVGDSNPDWRLQQLLSLIDQLYKVATAEQRQRVAETLEKITFFGVYLDPADKYRRATAVGTLKVSGPLVDTLRPIQPSLTQLAIDPKTSKAYGVTMHELFEVDLATGKTMELKLANRKDLPRFSWTAGVAFDTQRRRLLVMTSHVYSRVYAYDVDDDHWSLLTTSRGALFGGVAYHAKEDVLYMPGREGSSGHCTALHKFTPDGNALEVIQLSEPILNEQSSLGRMQITSLNDEMFVIIPAPSKEADVSGSSRVTRVYVVNRHTGEIIYSCIHSKQTE